MTNGLDQWHRWLLDGRYGGDTAYRERILVDFLYPVRDKILDRARLQPGETLLDVGAGDGLVAFGALERLGSAGHVIFADISRDLLDHCRAAAAAEGRLERCRFLLTSADSLTDVADASVDVVTTRSVLIYVQDKAAAFRQFYRVLRPGGRVSIAEPINALMGADDPDRFFGYDVTPIRDLAAKIEALYESIQPHGRDPMGDFDERDLVRQAEQAGFPEVDLELRVSVKNARLPMTWEGFSCMSGNPLIPAFGEAVDRTLSPQEADVFARHLRPLVESGNGVERRAMAYLTAAKS